MVPTRRSSGFGHVKPLAMSITLLKTTAVCTVLIIFDRATKPTLEVSRHASSFGQDSMTQLGWKAPRPAVWIKHCTPSTKLFVYSRRPKPSMPNSSSTFFKASLPSSTPSSFAARRKLPPSLRAATPRESQIPPKMVMPRPPLSCETNLSKSGFWIVSWFTAPCRGLPWACSSASTMVASVSTSTCGRQFFVCAVKCSFIKMLRATWNFMPWKPSPHLTALEL
mmetsp:Transcript_105050/g.302272  ORF Transcript_105050/g.302272 Transcript_105050/m.302272 type:complete len:223 (+) Transcript_105050:929-1597(+)